MVHHLTEPEIGPMMNAVRHADALTTSSLRWQRRLEGLTGRPVTVVPYTIDTALFRPSSDRKGDRRRIGFDDSKYVIGFSARARADANGRKGIPLFREILRDVASRWSDAAVLLIGAGWESQVQDIRSTGLQVVHVEPPTADATAALYPAMDVFVCTSNEEGGPCTILEAMASDVPIVTTDVGHVPEVVEHGRTGFVVREPGSREFMEAMTVLRRDADQRREVVAAARRFVVEERDHRTGLRDVDIDSVYRLARAAFQERALVARPIRFLSRTVLQVRHAARRVGRVIRQR
jgi:glycosyltransferase involved in cell wall biosynthesis